MPYKIFLLPIILCCSFFFSKGQADVIPVLKHIKSERIILKNENDLLPLKRLDTLKIACITLGLEKENNFSQTLALYTQIQNFPLPGDANFLKSFLQIQSQLSEYNLLIIAASVDLSDHNYQYDRIENMLAYLSEQTDKKKVLLLFDKFDRGKLTMSTEAMQSILYVPSVQADFQSLAAQTLFGGIGTAGKLKRNISDEFKKGHGLELEDDFRLSYSIPEQMSINAALLEDSIEAIVEQGLREKAYPGAQVLVAKDGHVIYHKAFGFHTYDNLRPVQLTDVYDFASVTKVTSALPALMKLYGEGQFDLDAPFEQYFPYFKNSDKAQLSFRSMLAHNARLHPYIVYWQNTLKKNGRYKARTFKTKYSEKYPVRITDNLYLHHRYKKKIYKAIKKSPLNEEAGYRYSGLSFLIYPEIVSKLCGEDYESYLYKTFYHKLGAHSLLYNPYKHLPLEQIVPTERDTFFRKIQVHGSVHDEASAMLGGISANAGLFGNANDLAKLFQMYLNGGVYGGERYIAEEAIKEFTRCQYCEKGNRRGLGFDKPLIKYTPDGGYIAKDAGPDSFGHSGFTGIFVWVDPKENILVVFLSNRVYPTRENTKLYSLDIRARLHQAVYGAIKK